MNWIRIMLVGAICLLGQFAGCREKSNSEQQNPETNLTSSTEIIPAAYRLDEYLTVLDGKKIGMIVNHTSMVGSTHIVDTLLSHGIQVTRIFSPEHGFRGDADAGAHIDDQVDQKTGLPIVSLYGDNKKPATNQIEDLDYLIFDIQDVGVRFYTYISTMHYAMEACAENNKSMIVLDRPNPNGHYYDGPILQDSFKSFVGLHPIPVVHGLTVGELANMINEEGWLAGGKKCDLQVIEVENYDHSKSYELPVKPSPNLPNMQSIYLYPSTCLFEGTKISLGRGTFFPFQVAGYPDTVFGDFVFVPESIQGMSTRPPYQDQKCYGVDLREVDLRSFSLEYIIDFYQKAPFKDEYFNNYFNKLAGNSRLMEKIQAGWTEAEIRELWKEDLADYGKLREKYLLYPDA